MITDAIDVKDDDIVNAINVGANVILGTTGVINFNSFDVDGSGNVDIAGNFTNWSHYQSTGTGTVSLNGATTVAAGKNLFWLRHRHIPANLPGG